MRAAAEERREPRVDGRDDAWRGGIGLHPCPKTGERKFGGGPGHSRRAEEDVNRVLIRSVATRAIVMFLETVPTHLPANSKLAVGEPSSKSTARERKGAKTGAKGVPVHKRNRGRDPSEFRRPILAKVTRPKL